MTRFATDYVRDQGLAPPMEADAPAGAGEPRRSRRPGPGDYASQTAALAPGGRGYDQQAAALRPGAPRQDLSMVPGHVWSREQLREGGGANVSLRDDAYVPDLGAQYGRPAPRPGHQVDWRRPGASAQLFDADGPERTDVMQGQAGDCYLMASLSAVAGTDPQIIRRMVAVVSPGRYRVRFHTWSDGQLIPHDEFVTDELPAHSATGPIGSLAPSTAIPIYARSTDGPDEIWVAIVEKAYAQWHGGGYEGINQGGFGTQALEEITGVRSGEVIPAREEADALLQRIVRAVGAGHPMVAGTASAEVAQAHGLSGPHAYTVLSADVTARTVTLRNPHARSSTDTAGSTTGAPTMTPTVSIEVFQQAFASLSISGA